MKPYKIETPSSIWRWGDETFGKRTTAEIGVRTNLEVAELTLAFSNNHSAKKCMEELADVAIMTWQLAVQHSTDARPTPSRSFINAARDTPLANVLALNRAFGVYLERMVCSGLEQSEHLKKTLMALEQTVFLLDVDLPELVDQKMMINRNRVWRKLDSGHFQHAAAQSDSHVG